MTTDHEHRFISSGTTYPTEGTKRTRVDTDGTEHKEILRWADATTDPEMELWVTRIIMALFFAVGLYLGHNGLPF